MLGHPPTAELVVDLEACIRGLGSVLVARRSEWDDACLPPVVKDYRQHSMVAPHLQVLHARHGAMATLWCAAYLVHEWCPTMGGRCPTGHRPTDWWKANVCPSATPNAKSILPFAAMTIAVELRAAIRRENNHDAINMQFMCNHSAISVQSICNNCAVNMTIAVELR